MNRGASIGLGLLVGYAADRSFGDPRRFHPVAGFGAAAIELERRTYRDDRLAGVIHTAVLVGATVLVGRVVGSGVVPTAIATWTVLGGTSLARTGNAMADRLDAADIAGARELLPSLCGRDPDLLDADGLARAALESVAENTSDATVAPLVWGAVAGVPGLLGYRAINTLDAMLGYRNEKYERFGWAAARTDDVANIVPARVTGWLTVLLAPVVGGSPAAALQAWRADAGRHPSPNAGVAEASMAGALGVTLGGRTAYRHGVEIRPTLGSGPRPTAADLRRAVRLSTAVQGAAVVVSAAAAVAVGELVLFGHRRGRRLGRRPAILAAFQ
ncbi:cobalamin biosynthesis protein [Antrihabitans stalactiti]|uniref:Cobalamin biosynthesis protein CobD n=1 Tax=Antrihabitans stalactiti TaxID=2584121 RepID=A0A848KF06_9NOCA|nr:cobalamin biosynthesis protein [Antrihabitans stalactiti]NMN94760.1 cobalamin biosynthesis protein [Antrihabitans stalactiti]